MSYRILACVFVLFAASAPVGWGEAKCQLELRKSENLQPLMFAYAAGRTGLTTAVSELRRVAETTRNEVVRTVSRWAILRLSPSEESAAAYVHSFPGAQFCQCFFDLEIVIPEVASGTSNFASDLLESLVALASRGNERALRTLFDARAESDASCSESLDGWLTQAFVGSPPVFSRVWKALPDAESRERIVDALAEDVPVKGKLRACLGRGARSKDPAFRELSRTVLNASMRE